MPSAADVEQLTRYGGWAAPAFGDQVDDLAEAFQFVKRGQMPSIGQHVGDLFQGVVPPAQHCHGGRT